MKGVTNYLKNITKSVAYATADVIKQDLIPNVDSFANSNKEFMVNTYSAVRNPKASAKKTINAFKESKYYNAIDYGARNLFEDLRTGNLYNKERYERDENKFSGWEDFDDLSDFDVDDGIDNKSSNTITDGDKLVIESIENTSRTSANITAKIISDATKYNVNNSRLNIGILFEQNERLFNGLHKDISISNALLDSMHKVISTTLPNMDKNLADYFSKNMDLYKETNAMIKEMLELQRNVYKSAGDREYEAGSKKSGKVTWSDISDSNGNLDLSAYIESLKNGIKSWTDMFTSMTDMVGDPRAAFISPGEYIVKGLVRKAIPKMVKDASKEFDNTINKSFATIMARLSNKKAEGDIFSPMGMLSQFLGLDTSMVKIGSGKYYKGAVPFDGLTRKSILEVIPTYLRRIDAGINGREELIYNYDTGKWVTHNAIKNDFDSIKKKTIDYHTSDLMKNMNNGIYAIRNGMRSMKEQDEFDRAIEEFKLFLFDHLGDINENASAKQNNVTEKEYPYFYKYYKDIMTVYKNIGTDRKTGMQKYLSNKMISDKMFEARASLDRQYREIQASGHDLRVTQLASGIDHNTHGSLSNGKFIPHNLLNTKDDLGNSIYSYLQKITAELQLIRSSNVVGKTRKGKVTGSLSDNDIKRMLMNKSVEEDARNKAIEEQDAYNKAVEDNNNFVNRNIIIGNSIDRDLLKTNSQKYYKQLSLISSIGDKDSNKMDLFMEQNFIKQAKEKYPDDEKKQKEWVDHLYDQYVEGKDKLSDKYDNIRTKYTGVAKVIDKLNGAKTSIKNIANAPAQMFSNLLYSADRAIYNMFFKSEVEDDDHNKYKGYLEFLVGKAVDTFDKSVNKFEEKFNGIKDKVLKSLGIDDKFKSDFKDSMKNIGTSAWKYFKQSNIDVYNDARRSINKMKFKAKTPEEQKLLIREASLNALYANKKQGDRRGVENIPNNVYLKDPAKMKEVLKEAGVFKNISEDKLNQYYDENTETGAANITKAYDRYMQRTHATGTFGTPFMGKSMLSKGELLFNDSGVSVVNKTGAYSVDKPTHILNSYDSYNVLNKMGLGFKGSKPSGSKQSTIMKDLAKENSIKNRIFNHAEGTSNTTTDNIKDIIDKLKNKYKDLDIDFDQIKEDVSASKGKIAAGGVVGGLASLLFNIVGGPILGALVGSTASFISSNDELKDKLFGEKDAEGKRNGGRLLNAKIMNAVNKYLPDMGKYGMVGIIPGLLTPLGAIGGLLAGGAIGFLKNNESFMDKYFGERDENGERQGGKLNISKSSKDVISKFLPAGAKGAAVGAIASVLVGGPFGLLGNAALGSAVGMMSTTDEFKDGILGKSINGVRSGGLLDKISRTLDPITNPFIEIKDRFIDILDKNIADPLSRFINPFIHQIPIMLGAVPKMINDAVADKISRVKTSNNLAGKVVRGAGKLATGAANFVTSPFRFLGFAGDKLRMHQIKNGTADDMTAAERIEFARSQLKLSDNDEKNKAILDKFNQDNAFDMALADISKEGGMSIEDAEALRDNMTSVTDSIGSLRRQKQKAAKDITGYLSNVQLKNGGKLDAKKLNKALRDGKINEFEKSLRKSMTAQEYNDFKQSTGDAFKVFNEASRREKIAGSMTKADKETAFRKSADALKQFGIDVKSPDELLKYSKLIDTEILNIKANGNRKEDKLLNKQPENVDKIRTAVENIADMIAGLTGNDIGRNSKVIRDAENIATNSDSAVDYTIKKAENRSYDLYEDQADRITNEFGETPDILTNNKAYNKLGNYVKDRYISAKVVDKINPKHNNIKLLVRIKDLKYSMDDETVLYFNNELSRVKCKNIYDVLKCKNVRKLLKGRNLSIDDLNMLSRIIGNDKKQFDRKCGTLLANGKSSNNISISDIINMDFNDAYSSDTIENNGIGTFLLSTAAKGLIGGAKAIGSGIVGGIKKIGSGLSKDEDKESSKAGLLSSLFGNNHIINTNSKPSGNLNSDETDDPNDGKDVAQLDGGFGKYIKKSDGSIEWDESDPATKMLLNIRRQKEALQEKYQAAQLKTSDMFDKLFNNDEEKGQKKLKWWQLLLAGIVAAPFVKKFIGNFVKPVWDQAVSPWIKDKALPWLEDKFTKAKDWLFDSALPKLQDGIGVLLAEFAENLPQIIWSGIKGTFKVGSSFAGHIFGKKSNVGGKTTLNTENRNGSELSNITDGNGNKLTYDQISSGEYNDNMYNAQGAKATVDEDGNITFEDESSGNAAYVSRMTNAMARSFIKGNTGVVLSGTSKLATKLLGNKNILSKGAGLGLKTITAPLEFAANPMKAITTGSDKITTAIGKSGDKALKIVEGCKSLINKLFGDTKVMDKLAKLADVLGINNIDEWIIGIHSKLDDLFGKTIQESAEKVGKSQLGQAVSKVTSALGPIMAVADFLTGCDKAESILGISDTGIVEEVVAGITNAVCNFTIILSIIPGVGPIASSIMKLFTDSNEFEQRQKEADEEIERYNEENGTTYSKEEYLERNKSFTGKVWGGIKDTASGVARKVKSLFSFGSKSSESEDSSVASNAVGTIGLDSVSSINPFINLNNSITDIINKLTTGENNTDDIIEKAKNGQISIFSREFWENTISKKQGLAGTIETAYNSLSKIIQLPLIMSSKLFGGVGGLATTLSKLAGVSINNTQNNTVQQSSESSSSSSSSSDGIFTKIWKGVKSLFGKGSGRNKYGTGFAKQIDPAIANIRFNAPGDTEYQTIGDSACGPAAAVSAVQSAFGRGKNNVIDASKYAIEHGYKEKNGGTKPAFFKDYFDKNGLDSETTSDRVKLANRITNGQPTVLMGSGGVYGSGTHYLAATGTDGYGNVYINDPSSPEDTQTYRINTVLKDSKFGVATKRNRSGRGKIIHTNRFGKGPTFTKYNLSANQLKGLANLCKQEQGSVKGAAYEASLMANLFEKKGSSYGSGADGLYKYVRNSGWFAHASKYMDGGNASQEYIDAVKDVLVNGKRLLPTYVDEHDCFSDISSATNNGVNINRSDRSQYKKDVTVCRNRYGSTWTFYAFADNSSDPFGYTSKSGSDFCYTYDGGTSGSDSGTTEEEPKNTGLIGLLSNSLVGKALSAFTGLFTKTEAKAATTEESSGESSDYTSSGSVSSLQQKVVDAANSIQSQKGYCAKWAHDVYHSAGQNPRVSGNAIDMVKYKVSNSKNPPVGAVVYGKHQWGATDSNPGYGHEGIYMGNNVIYSPEGGKPKQRSIEDWSQSSHYGWNGWGFDGWTELQQASGKGKYGRGSDGGSTAYGNDVVEASKYAINRGYKEKDGGTRPEFFRDYFNKNGLDSSMSYDKETILNNIANGQPTVLMGQDSNGVTNNTPYGPYPHYVTVTGLDDKGNAIVQDPESKYDNLKYNIKTLLNKSSFGVSARSKFGRGRFGRGDVASDVWGFLKSKGCTDEAAAGIMGNLKQESGMNPSVIQGGGKGPAAGICQWENYNTKSGRWKSMSNYAASKGKDWTDLQCQLEYLWKELEGADSTTKSILDKKYGGLTGLTSCTDINKACDIFEKSFERAGKPNMQNRYKYAKEYYDRFKGTAGTSGASGVANAMEEATNNLISNLSKSKAGEALTAFSELISGSQSSGSETTDSSGANAGTATGAAEQATAKMEAWAADDSHGYSQSNDRFGNPDFDCSGSVIRAWEESGVPVKTNGASYTGNMYDVFTKLGFKDVSSSVNKSTGSGLKRGDVLLNKGKHTAMWTGSGIVQASQSETGGISGKPGDQTGKEMWVSEGYHNFSGGGWDSILRYGTGKYGRSHEQLPNKKEMSYQPMDAYQSYMNSLDKNLMNKKTPKQGTVMGKGSSGGLLSSITNKAKDITSNLSSITASSNTTSTNNNTTINYSQLLNVIIEALATIADNTDRLNTIVSLLNERLGTDISTAEVSTASMNKESIKSKLKKALLNQQKNVMFDSNSDNSSMNVIINAMNAIASE